MVDPARGLACSPYDWKSSVYDCANAADVANNAANNVATSDKALCIGYPVFLWIFSASENGDAALFSGRGVVSRERSVRRRPDPDLAERHERRLLRVIRT